MLDLRLGQEIFLSLPLALALVAGRAASQGRVEAPFEAANIVIDDDYGRMDAILDLDWDGDMDAVGFFVSPSSAFKGELRAFSNDGKGRFTWVSLLILDIAVNQPSNILTCGDFDGDGHDDFVLLGSQRMASYSSRAGQPPLLQRFDVISADPWDGVAGDFDGDGRDDLATLSSEGLRIYTMGLSISTLLPSSGSRLLSAELTGDGLDDVAMDTGAQFNVVTFDHGNFVEGLSIGHASLPGLMPTAGDVDNDGDVDVVLFGETHYVLLRRSGPTGLAVEAPRLGGPADRLADIDGDGDLDGVCCGGGGGPPAPQRNRERNFFHIARNETTAGRPGVFEQAIRVPSLGARHLAGAADIDGDGYLDLVAGRSVLFGRDHLPGDLASLHIDNRWEVADIDRDGDPDFDLGLSSNQRNRGDGSYVSEAPRMPAPPAGTSWGNPDYLGDFDGDGAVDLIVAHLGAPLPGQFAPTLISQRLLRNCGGGHFVDAGPAGPAGTLFKPPAAFGFQDRIATLRIIADMDGDGDLDIATNTTGQVFAPDRAQLWFNDGAGSFTLAEAIEGGTVLAAADFNADGYSDLLLGVVSSFAMRLGSANGYAAGQTLMPRLSTSPAAVADFNGDGYADALVLTRQGTLGVATPTIFFGGPAPFSEVRVLSDVSLQSALYTTVPYDLLAGDLDGNGRIDLAINSLGEADRGLGAWIGLQDVAGNFAFVRQYLDLQKLADLDGDGDLDALGDLLVKNARYGGASSGSRQQYGSVSSGSGDLAPTLGAVGPFRPGEVMELRMSGGLGGAPGIYWMGRGRANLSILGLGLNIWPLTSFRSVVLDGNPGEAGAGNASIGYPIPPAMAGGQLFMQAFFLDTAGPLGVSASTGLELHIGR